MDFLKKILDTHLFSTDGYKLSLQDLLLFTAIFIAFIFMLRFVMRRLLPRFFKIYDVGNAGKSKIKSATFVVLSLIFILAALWSLHLDAVLYSSDYITIKVSNILQAILVIRLARILDNIINKIKNKNQDEELRVTTPGGDTVEKNQAHIIQWLVYLIAALILVNFFEIDKPLVTIKGFSLKISSILIVIIILFGSRLLAWFLTNILLQPYYARNKIERGAQYAVNQLMSYIIYLVAFFFALHVIDVQMSLILGGAAALLVGVGLGLQQTFNDFFSGITLLTERSIDIGDVVNINNTVGTVRHIGIRTSKIETRGNLTMIVPNSKLTSDNVINWTHFNNLARLEVKVPVPFSADPELVRTILLKAILPDPRIQKYPEPSVVFNDFGQYAHDFILMAWSTDVLNFEDIKSELRFEIKRLFKENGIEIPYPIQFYANTPES